jgi:hypothetical protein
VVSGTPIQSAWANATLYDIKQTFDNTLPRDGQAAMSGALKVVDGTTSVPSISFNSEQNTGLYRPAAQNLAVLVTSNEVLRVNANGRLMLGTATDDGVNRLQVNGNIVPASNATSNLGSSSNWWNTVYAVSSSASSVSAANLTATNLVATSATVTNLSTGNALITGGSISAAFTGNAALTTLTAANFSTGNAQITGGSISGTGAFSTLVATNFSSANAQITGGSISAAFTGNAAFTYLTAANFSTGNAQITGASLTGITACNPTANVSVDLGSSGAWWGTFYGTATQAKYADLAEMYVSDKHYEPGTVLIFGGTHEVTTTGKFADRRVAGAVSTAPAYLMNSMTQGVALALRGRVPVKVIGRVRKGDLLVTSHRLGHAQALPEGYRSVEPNAVFAKSLETKYSDGEGYVEAVML